LSGAAMASPLIGSASWVEAVELKQKEAKRSKMYFMTKY